VKSDRRRSGGSVVSERPLIQGLDVAWSDDIGPCVGLSALFVLLRSDETREAIARAIFEGGSNRIPWEALSLRGYWLAEADAVVRVLTGEGER
jgi:hypothetical protein